LWGTSVLRHRELSRLQEGLIAAIGATVLLAGALVASRSSLFDARSIHVKAGDRLSERQVLRIAGVGAGTNLVWLSTGGVVARLEANPWISSATVEKELPSTLRISVKEQSPVLARNASSGYELLTEDGSVVARSTSARGLPVVSAPTPSGFRSAADALGAMSPWLREEISSGMVESSGDLTLHLGAEGVVAYGPPTDAEAKGIALGGIVRWAEAHRVTLGAIDVTAPSAPTARPAEGTLPGSAEQPCHGTQQAKDDCA
jgi:cell division protein FtsQ